MIARPPYRVKVRAETVDNRVVAPTPDESYDGALRAALPGVTTALALAFAALTVLHPLMLDGLARAVMTGAAAATALAFAAAALVLRRHALPLHLAHPVGAALIAVCLTNAVAHMVLVSQPRQSTNLMLAIVGAGVLLLSLRWMLVVLYLTWGAWLVAALAVGSSDQWPHYAIGMVLASALGTVVNYLRRADVRRLAEVRCAAEAAAVRDHLTGVANRRGLAMVGAQLLEQARRQGDAVHCIFVDVDGLKKVNDALGHSAGDEVLVAVADALRQVTRATDVVARWGGDEFCVVGPGAGMPPLELERRVRDCLLPHFPVPVEAWSGRVSAGGSMLAPWDAGTLETLLGKADQEMYLRRALRREDAGPSPRRAATE